MTDQDLPNFLTTCELTRFNQFAKDFALKIYSGYLPSRDCNRSYHNIIHLEQMLKFIKTHFSSQDLGDFSNALFLAVLAHDLVYKPGAANNEEESYQAICKITDNVQLPLVEKLILATKHNKLETDFLCQVICDADLSILSSPYPIYLQYVDQVHLEYEGIYDDIWRNGRKDWIDSMLNRGFIYYSPRLSLQNEIAKLNLLKERELYV